MNRSKLARGRCLRPWMRSSVLSLCFLMATCGVPMTASAFQVTLAWDSNSEPDVIGYKIYYGEQSRNYTYCVDVGHATSCVISGLTSGHTYYFTANAYDMNGNESGFAEEIFYQIPVQEPDSDNDGMPDAWEIENNLDPLRDDADDDPDGDNFSNLQEYLADTDPRDPNSLPGLSHPNLISIILLLLPGD